jgi:flagellar FliJ protein
LSWTDSLIRVREFEIDTLKKRLAAVVAHRARIEAALAGLGAEAEAEAAHARGRPETAWSFAAFRAGWVQRRAAALAELKVAELEEAGCRDALSDAYAELKKVERVAEAHARAAAQALARREAAALDEIALRRKAV